MLGPRIAANDVAREQRVPAEEPVPGSLEVHPFGQLDRFESCGSEPDVVVRGLSLAGFVPEPRQEDLVMPHESRIGGEDQIGKPFHGRHQSHIDAQRDQQGVQVVPLLAGFLGITRPAPVHPGIDFIFDPVVIGGAHQNGGPNPSPFHDRSLR